MEPESRVGNDPESEDAPPFLRNQRWRGVVEEDFIEGAADLELPPAAVPPPATSPDVSADAPQD